NVDCPPALVSACGRQHHPMVLPDTGKRIFKCSHHLAGLWKLLLTEDCTKTGKFSLHAVEFQRDDWHQPDSHLADGRHAGITLDRLPELSRFTADLFLQPVL